MIPSLDRDPPPISKFVQVRPPLRLMAAQRLRDFRPEGGVGAPEPVGERPRDHRAERRWRDLSSAEPMRILTIQTKTPGRLYPGVVHYYPGH